MRAISFIAALLATAIAVPGVKAVVTGALL